MKNSLILSAFSFLILVLFAQTEALASFTSAKTQEADIVKTSTSLRSFAHKDIRFSGVGTLETNIQQDISAIVTANLGFSPDLGGYIKWNPYPQTTRQPAISLISGASLGKDGNENTQFDFVVAPIVSKNFGIEYGEVAPYFSPRFNYTQTNNKDSALGSQLLFGFEYKVYEADLPRFHVETAWNITNTDSYIAFGASWDIPNSTFIRN